MSKFRFNAQAPPAIQFTLEMNRGEAAFIAQLLKEFFESPIDVRENETSAEYRRAAQVMFRPMADVLGFDTDPGPQPQLQGAQPVLREKPPLEGYTCAKCGGYFTCGHDCQG